MEETMVKTETTMSNIGNSANNLRNNVPVKYDLTLDSIEYTVFQLSLILGEYSKSFSRGELLVMSYLYNYPDIKICQAKILEEKLRTSAKSIQNDITKFRQMGILSTDKGMVIFNPDIIIFKEPKSILVTVNLK